MALKRKVVGIEHWEGTLQSQPDGLEEAGKKRRVNVKTEPQDVGATPTGKEEDVLLSRSVKVEETEKTIKVKAEVDIVKDGPATDMLDDGDASKGLSGEEDLEEERRTYEEERNRMLEQNRKRMRELGLPDLTNQLCPTFRTRTHLKSALAANGKKNKIKHELEAGFQPRRSGRYAGKAEVSKLPLDAGLEELCAKRKEERMLRRRSKPTTASTAKREEYTEEHIKLLGSYTKEWQLFRDGYVPGGGARIYDSENGKTCHQCRQKTLGLRTWCSQCNTRSGQFCGDCLFMRYGENVLEANANMKWVCPVCRGICNCSICRVRKGLAPTGNLFRHALAEGFKSVAHYLIMTQQHKPGCEGEKVDQGGESKGVDQSEVTTEEVQQKKDIDDSNLQPQTPSPPRRISRSDFKIVKEEVNEAVVSGELQHNKAVRLEQEFQRVESKCFFMAKVEIKAEVDLEETRGAPDVLCKKRAPEECDGLIPDASPAEDANKKRKGVEGTHDISPRGHVTGATQGTEPEPIPEEEKKVVAPGDGALSPGARCTRRSARLEANKSSVAVKKEICILTTPVFPPEDSKPCREEILLIQRTETSAKDDSPAKKLPGRTKAEVARERLILKGGGSHLSSTEMLPCPPESISRRLRTKEAINYKRFL